MEILILISPCAVSDALGEIFTKSFFFLTERKALLKKEEQDPTGKRKTRLGDGKQRIVLDTLTDR